MYAEPTSITSDNKSRNTHACYSFMKRRESLARRPREAHIQIYVESLVEKF